MFSSKHIISHHSSSYKIIHNAMLLYQQNPNHNDISLMKSIFLSFLDKLESNQTQTIKMLCAKQKEKRETGENGLRNGYKVLRLTQY